MKERVAEVGVICIKPGPGFVYLSDGPPWWATTARCVPGGLFKPLLVITSLSLDPASTTRDSGGMYLKYIYSSNVHESKF